jgi:hypothetical protein
MALSENSSSARLRIIQASIAAMSGFGSSLTVERPKGLMVDFSVELKRRLFFTDEF